MNRKLFQATFIDKYQLLIYFSKVDMRKQSWICRLRAGTVKIRMAAAFAAAIY